MCVNYRIIEGDYSKYDEFVRLYNDYSLDVLEIKKQIGNNIYSKLRKEALEKGDIKPRPFNLRRNVKYKYYHYDKDRKQYRVRKVKNGKYMSFGFYDTEEEAKEKVEQLLAVDWDISKLVGLNENDSEEN